FLFRPAVRCRAPLSFPTRRSSVLLPWGKRLAARRYALPHPAHAAAFSVPAQRVQLRAAHRDRARRSAAAGRYRRGGGRAAGGAEDRKSTRLNSSHVKISYAVFCVK